MGETWRTRKADSMKKNPKRVKKRQKRLFVKTHEKEKEEKREEKKKNKGYYRKKSRIITKNTSIRISVNKNGNNQDLENNSLAHQLEMHQQKIVDLQIAHEKMKKKNQILTGQ